MSTFPFEETDHVAISHERVIAEARIVVNGRPITLTSTHLDPDSQPVRLAQAKEVITWCAARPEDRILTGDFNAWPDQSSIAEMGKAYLDSWAEAAKTARAFSFSGNNPTGATKNGRIDYIFYSKGATNLSVVRSDVIDTRDAKGVMPSDHRPVVTTFQVR